MDDYANDDAPPAPQDPHPSSSNGEKMMMENGGGGGGGASLDFVPRDGVPGYGRDDEEGAVGGGGRGDESIISGSQSAEGGNLYIRPAFFGNLAHACLATDIESLFLNPPPPPGASSDFVRQPFGLDRVVSLILMWSFSKQCQDLHWPFSIAPHFSSVHTLYSFIYLHLQDIKRGFCFVFFKEAPNMEEKRRTEDFVDEINGMYVYNNNYSFNTILQSSLSSSSSLSPISTVPCH
jgi:hypothetical protein